MVMELLANSISYGMQTVFSLNSQLSTLNFSKNSTFPGTPNSRIHILRTRERSLLYFRCEGLHTIMDDLVEVAIRFDELGTAAQSVLKEIVEDEHLAIATGTSSNADGRNSQLLGDLLAERGRHPFDDDGKSSRSSHRLGITEQSGFIALYPEASHAMQRLWCQANMSHHGNICSDDGSDGFSSPFPTFQLDRMSATFLHQSTCVLQSLGRADLVGHERHIGDDQAALGCPADQRTVVDHIFERYRQRMTVPLHHHAQRVADQLDVNPCFIQDLRGGIIVRSDHHDLRPCLLGQ